MLILYKGLYSIFIYLKPCFLNSVFILSVNPRMYDPSPFHHILRHYSILHLFYHYIYTKISIYIPSLYSPPSFISLPVHGYQPVHFPIRPLFSHRLSNIFPKFLKLFLHGTNCPLLIGIPSF